MTIGTNGYESVYSGVFLTIALWAPNRENPSVTPHPCQWPASTGCGVAVPSFLTLDLRDEGSDRGKKALAVCAALTNCIRPDPLEQSTAVTNLVIAAFLSIVGCVFQRLCDLGLVNLFEIGVLGQGTMLSEKQRRTAVPRLLDYADDWSLDPETRKWVFQALRDITGQTLPSEGGAWRTWFRTAGGK